jgi:hypothetical protein
MYENGEYPLLHSAYTCAVRWRVEVEKQKRRLEVANPGARFWIEEWDSEAGYRNMGWRDQAHYMKQFGPYGWMGSSGFK